ncbi:ATP/GTP-binding protein [Streptomyces griseofuscus]|uniref:ATP/GTP-binding protein n=1 Tax=Streptomyces griseofuscus TaxID=146922 RepID=UPI0036F53109
MLRRAAAIALLPASVLATVAYGESSGGICNGTSMYVKVCATASDNVPGTGSSDDRKGSASASSAAGSGTPKCTYEKVIPQPPPENLAMQDGKRHGGKGAVYRVWCPDTGRFGVVWIPDSTVPRAPAIDPETVARRAVDAMKLMGPKVASPREGGKYVVGMPMWMWVDQTLTTYGPNRATASAGGVTVTATAEVSSISWEMGDGTAAVVCKGPGARYIPSMGMARSPDCGHVYGRASIAEAGGKFHGTATATWTVNWQVTGDRAETGSLTEVRQSRFTAEVGEVQVLN